MEKLLASLYEHVDVSSLVVVQDHYVTLTFEFESMFALVVDAESPHEHNMAE